MGPSVSWTLGNVPCSTQALIKRNEIEPVKANSHQANAKVIKIKEQSEEIKRKRFKHQRKISHSHSFSLGVNRPLVRALPIC